MLLNQEKKYQDKKRYHFENTSLREKGSKNKSITSGTEAKEKVPFRNITQIHHAAVPLEKRKKKRNKRNKMYATKCTISRKGLEFNRKAKKPREGNNNSNKSTVYWHLRCSTHPPFSMLSAGFEDDVWVLGIR